jgi:ABC-type lipoprotein release transport system permease subunit
MAAGGGIAMLLRSFLFGIQPLDPPTFVAVPVILLGVALLAAVIPAARASSVQASVALKEE